MSHSCRANCNDKNAVAPYAANVRGFWPVFRRCLTLLPCDHPGCQFLHAPSTKKDVRNSADNDQETTKDRLAEAAGPQIALPSWKSPGAGAEVASLRRSGRDSKYLMESKNGEQK